MEDNFPVDAESTMNAKWRADTFKQEIFCHSKQMHRDPANKDKKIGVVCHSMFLKVLTSKDSYWKDANDHPDAGEIKMPGPEDSSLMMNC